MPKPTSIRAIQFITYVLLAMFAVFVIPSLFTSELPKDSYQALSYFLIFIGVASLVTIIIGIRKRKYIPSLIAAIALFIVTFGAPLSIFTTINLVLFFLRSTRLYFSEQPVEQEVEQEQDDAEQTEEVSEGVEGEALAVPKITQKALTKKKEAVVSIREATPEDSDTVHSLMLIAFEEYRSAIPPSSALEETDESVREALQSGQESAAILFEDDTAVAMVRFKYIDDAIYFFRLSVIPSKRRRGYARQLVKWVEKQGVTKGMNISRCRVRQSVHNNLVLYQDMSYEIVDQELFVRPAGTIKALTLEKKLGV